MSEKTFDPQLSQQDLAEMIDREGLAFEARCQKSHDPLRKIWHKGQGKASDYLPEYGWEIRLAPGALTEFGLKTSMVPHNPDGLPADQITEGGRYRAAVPGDEINGGQCWHDGEWWSQVANYAEIEPDFCHTYRVPVNTPFPKPSRTESSAEQSSATQQAGQSLTPRTDSYGNRWHRLSEITYGGSPLELMAATCFDGIGCIVSWVRRKDGGYNVSALDTEGQKWETVDFSDQANEIPPEPPIIWDDITHSLQTELTAALAQRDEALDTLDLMCDEFQRIKALADLPSEAHTFCDRAISGIKQRVPLVEQRDKAEKERDEANRLLRDVNRVLQEIYDDTEGYADGAPDASAHDRLCNDISGKIRQPLTQITNHLKP